MLQEPRKKVKESRSSNLKRKGIESDEESPPRKTVHRRKAVVYDSDEDWIFVLVISLLFKYTCFIILKVTPSHRWDPKIFVRVWRTYSGWYRTEILLALRSWLQGLENDIMCTLMHYAYRLLIIEGQTWELLAAQNYCINTIAFSLPFFPPLDVFKISHRW